MSFRMAVVRIITLILIGLIGVLVFYNRMNDYLKGPQDMASDNFIYEAEKYVKYSLQDFKVIDCFLLRNDTDAKGKTTSYYYYILGKVNKTNDSVECIVAIVDADKKNIYDFYNSYFKKEVKGKKQEKLENYTDIGILKSLDSNIEKKLREYLIAGGNLSDTSVISYQPYYIVSYEPTAVDLFVCSISGLLIVVALLELFLILIGFKQRKIRKYLERAGKEGIVIAEKDYLYSRFFTKSIRIGDLYTYLFLREGINLIENRKILWIYECTATGNPGRGSKPDAGYSGIEIWDDEFRCYEVFLNDKDMAKRMLDYMANTFPYIIVGYNLRLSELFFRKHQEFRSLVYDKYWNVYRMEEK